MFNNLGDRFQDVFQSLRGRKALSEDNIEAAINQVRRALLESDVSLKAVKLFTTRVRERAIGTELIKGVQPDQQFIKIINDALVEILGGTLTTTTTTQESTTSSSKSQLPIATGSILLLGLQGAGKTTAAAKLAYKLKAAGKKPLLVPCDLQRPAAIKQLEILAEQAELDFLKYNYINEAQNASADPELMKDLVQVRNIMDVARFAKSYAQENNIDTVIYDTAGRLQVDTDLMAELLLLEKAVQADEKLLVIDSLIGQEAANIAETFNTQIGFSGVILTKLDGDSKGGAALSVVEATQKPIKLVSIGEKLEDLEIFYPDRMASRILGMGDIVSLVEKAEAKIEEEEAQKLEEQLMKGNFNYETFMSAQKMMSKLGNMGSIFKMMGMGSMFSQMGLNSSDQETLLDEGEKKTRKFQIAINSMTLKERRNPDLLNQSRKRRIAKGAGLKEKDVDQLSAEFNKLRKVFSQIQPMLNLMGSGGAKPADEGAAAQSKPAAAANPADMMNMLAASLSKKQRKAMQRMGGVPGMAGPSTKPASKLKKGFQPQVKGFRD